ncbi:MAG TPA: TMEM165/GDT1 family protein [Anaerovoracaceae bacterium]|nr:TMEM165/GDT1 family protein [Anaerovoracaceae bacterium]
MDSILIPYLFSAGAVVLAEMGDKTQLLAMAFATKYKASKVMIGVLIATILNHALAVAVGNYITRFDSAQVWIQGIAALSFIFFGLWTIRGDKLEGEENRTTKYGAIATVAVAFFFAEMGDKTQLATIALAAKFSVSPVWVLLGTLTGMMIADAVGIFVGVVMCKNISGRKIKLISAGAFILFGFVGSYQVAAEQLHFSTGLMILSMSALMVLTGTSVYFLIKKDNTKQAEKNPPVIKDCKLEKQNNELR